MEPVISVIVPTYNRLPVLKMCLEKIKDNDFDLPYEVIIIDDGSTDNTFAEIQEFITKKGWSNFFIFHQENGGPSKARNHGILRAKSNLLLIIGDDSIAKSNLLQEHYDWNTKKYPDEAVAILGYDEWSPEINITPFMRWIDANGLQFSYFRFTDEHSPTWGDLWTCNISIKKSFLEKFGMFDEQFPFAAWEDVELGWRLSKHGFKIKFNKDAIVHHYHPTDFKSVKRRMYCHGYAQKIMANKMGDEYHNRLFQQPLKTFLNIFDIITSITGAVFVMDKLCQILQNYYVFPPVFYAVMHHYKLKGIHAYEKKHK